MLHEQITDVIASIDPLDDLEVAHLADVHAWLAATTDIFRRSAHPPRPVKHLVCYFLLVDGGTGRVLLGEHRKSGLWLPSGGHVEPGEHPVETVRRECREELTIDARFSQAQGERPLMVTVTETVASAQSSHTDVSLWFVLEASESQPMVPDEREYRSVRWWSAAEICATDPALFDPHMRRMLTKLGLLTDPDNAHLTVEIHRDMVDRLAAN